jgi:hypothetical protein
MGAGGRPPPSAARSGPPLVVQRADYGSEPGRIRRVLKVSRPTVQAWITRVEAESWAGLLDTPRGPQEPPRQSWLPRLGVPDLAPVGATRELGAHGRLPEGVHQAGR